MNPRRLASETMRSIRDWSAGCFMGRSVVGAAGVGPARHRKPKAGSKSVLSGNWGKDARGRVENGDGLVGVEGSHNRQVVLHSQGHDPSASFGTRQRCGELCDRRGPRVVSGRGEKLCAGFFRGLIKSVVGEECLGGVGDRPSAEKVFVGNLPFHAGADQVDGNGVSLGCDSSRCAPSCRGDGGSVDETPDQDHGGVLAGSQGGGSVGGGEHDGPTGDLFTGVFAGGVAELESINTDSPTLPSEECLATEHGGS
jgi:hypothetical protein